MTGMRKSKYISYHLWTRLQYVVFIGVQLLINLIGFTVYVLLALGKFSSFVRSTLGYTSTGIRELFKR